MPIGQLLVPFGISQPLGELGQGVIRREEGALTLSGNNHNLANFIYIQLENQKNHLLWSRCHNVFERAWNLLSCRVENVLLEQCRNQHWSVLLPIPCVGWILPCFMCIRDSAGQGSITLGSLGSAEQLSSCLIQVRWQWWSWDLVCAMKLAAWICLLCSKAFWVVNPFSFEGWGGPAPALAHGSVCRTSCSPMRTPETWETLLKLPVLTPVLEHRLPFVFPRFSEYLEELNILQFVISWGFNHFRSLQKPFPRLWAKLLVQLPRQYPHFSPRTLWGVWV